MKGLDLLAVFMFVIGCYIFGAKLEELIEAFGMDLPDWTGMKIGIVIIDATIVLFFGRIMLRRDKD